MSFTKVSPSLNDEWTPLVIIVFFMEPHAPDRQWPSCEVHDTQELSVDGALRMAMTVHRSRASTAHLAWLRRRIEAMLRRPCWGLTKPVPAPPVEARLGGHARDGCWQPLPPQASRPPPPLSLPFFFLGQTRHLPLVVQNLCSTPTTGQFLSPDTKTFPSPSKTNL
jgi:hypothetical protein